MGNTPRLGGHAGRKVTGEWNKVPCKKNTMSRSRFVFPAFTFFHLFPDSEFRYEVYCVGSGVSSVRFTQDFKASILEDNGKGQRPAGKAHKLSSAGSGQPALTTDSDDRELCAAHGGIASTPLAVDTALLNSMHINHVHCLLSRVSRTPPQPMPWQRIPC